MSILPFTSPTGDQIYDEPFVKELRQELITLRDGALGQGEFHWSVLLSHTIAVIAVVLEEEPTAPVPQVAAPTTYLDRMRTELSELSTKLEKLTEFYNGPLRESLSTEKQNLLYEQRNIMEAYVGVLSRRIAVEENEVG